MGLRQRVEVCVVIVFAAATLTAPADAQPTFQMGDLYLISQCLPGDGGACTSGVVRIDPADWSSMRLADLSPAEAANRGAYDAFRDVLVVGGSKLQFMAADGTLSLLTNLGGVRAVAADGRGNIYICASSWFYVFDEQNVQHDLLDAAGDPVQMFDVYSLWYDRASSSLITGQGVLETTIARLPLSPDGLSIGGAVATVTLDVSPGSFEGPIGFSSGPNGTVFVKVDDNTNGLVPRMLLLDVPTMSLSNFAFNEYFGVAGETAGVYSAEIGGALTLDTSDDQLRFYTQGSIGPGAPIAVAGVSGNGGGEFCQLVVIESVVCMPDFNGDGTLDFFDVQRFLALFAAHDAQADLNHDGLWDFFDVQAFLNAFSAGCD